MGIELWPAGALVAGLVGAAALLGWRLRWLTVGGAAAAAMVGAAVLAGAGAGGAILLLLFFVSASAITTACRRPERAAPAGGSPVVAEARGRSARQVLANGGVAALAALLGLAGALPDAAYAVAGSLAAATADTWSTELGTRIGATTRLVTTWERVSPGRSGGVSWPGSAAAAVGAGLIGGAGGLVLGGAGGLELGSGGLELGAGAGTRWLALGLGAGLAGALADSLAGAGLEGRVRGVGNATVNLVGTATGALTGWGLGRLLLG